MTRVATVGSKCLCYLLLELMQLTLCLLLKLQYRWAEQQLWCQGRQGGKGLVAALVVLLFSAVLFCCFVLSLLLLISCVAVRREESLCCNPASHAVLSAVLLCCLSLLLLSICTAVHVMLGVDGRGLVATLLAMLFSVVLLAALFCCFMLQFMLFYFSILLSLSVSVTGVQYCCCTKLLCISIYTFSPLYDAFGILF